MSRSRDQGPDRPLDPLQRVTALRSEVERLLDDVDSLLDGLRRERHGRRPGEAAGEPGEDRQLSVEPDAGEAPDAER